MRKTVEREKHELEKGVIPLIAVRSASTVATSSS